MGTQRGFTLVELMDRGGRRRVKSQGSPPGEHAAGVLLFSLVADGQIKVAQNRRLAEDRAVLSQHTAMGRMIHQTLLQDCAGIR